jgi:hypothetical protein
MKSTQAMLAHKDFLRVFPVNLKTDRDCETPMVTEWVKKYSPFGSLLDIGAHWSGHHYAREIRNHVGQYDGIDIQPPDDLTRSILNGYFVGNVNDYHFDHLYDAVICVSTIEHAGVSTYKGDFLKERLKLFERALSITRKHFWISFPVGQPYVFEGEFAIVTEDHVAAFEQIAKGCTIKKRFFYSQGPQAGHPWYQHAKKAVAFKVPYMEFIGNQSIAVMEVTK